MTKKAFLFALTAIFAFALPAAASAEQSLLMEESYVRETDAGLERGSIAYEYDSEGILTRYVDSSTSAAGKQTINTYKVAFDASGIRTDSGKEQHGYILDTVEHEYDASGREIRRTLFSNTGAFKQEETWEYGPSGELLSYSFSSADSSYREMYEYLPSGSLSSLITEDGDGNVLQSCELDEAESASDVLVYLTKDGDGALLEREEQTVDAEGRVISWSRFNADGEQTAYGEYAYDLAGNRFYEVTYTRQAIEAEAEEDISYEFVTDGYRFRSYDASGRLIADELLDAEHLISTVSYTYSAVGQ